MKAPETLQFPELTHYDPDWIPLLHETRKLLRGRMERYICNALPRRTVEYRSGWSDDKEDLAVTEVRLTLAIGGPSIYLYADYDDGQVSNCKLVCNWWGDRAEITHDQDVMVRFIEYVNA